MLALIVPPCVLTAAAAPAPPAAPPPPSAPSAVMSADASSGEATMTSDSSAYSLGKPGATTCPSGYMLVVSAEACKQITSIKSGTGVETAMFMGQTGPATFATTSDGGGTTAAALIKKRNALKKSSHG